MMFYYDNPCVPVYATLWVEEGRTRQAPKVAHAHAVDVYAAMNFYSVTSCHVVARMAQHKRQYRDEKGDPFEGINDAKYRRVQQHTSLA